MRLARPNAFVLAAFLVVGLAIGASAARTAVDAGGTAGEHTSGFVSQPHALPASAARLERDHRPESTTSPRWTKHALLFLAVLAALLAVAGPWSQRTRTARHAPRPSTSLWFRSGGRAPPSFQLSVA
ncbi:MAG TPA: hypothetical protein VF230_06450 [Acidimicrobiales bacterium]